VSTNPDDWVPRANGEQAIPNFLTSKNFPLFRDVVWMRRAGCRRPGYRAIGSGDLAFYLARFFRGAAVGQVMRSTTIWDRRICSTRHPAQVSRAGQQRTSLEPSATRRVAFSADPGERRGFRAERRPSALSPARAAGRVITCRLSIPYRSAANHGDDGTHRIATDAGSQKRPLKRSSGVVIRVELARTAKSRRQRSPKKLTLTPASRIPRHPPKPRQHRPSLKHSPEKPHLQELWASKLDPMGWSRKLSPLTLIDKNPHIFNELH